ncbi:hypothetical protein ACVWZA_001695 [Sphingomonas sp. UYAg733]
MTRILVWTLLIGSALPLGGCVAAVATSAVGMAVRGAQGEPQNNEQLAPTARQACGAQASQYGTVHIIDVQQSSPSKIVVWGTADDGKQRRSFECRYGTKITGFKLRAIKASR